MNEVTTIGPDRLDEETIRAVRSGDTERFRELIGRHGDAVFSMLMRLTGDRGLAEEMAQEAFVKAFAGLGSYRGEARFRTWLIQIAVNLVRDWKRSRSRAPSLVSLEELRERSVHEADPVDSGYRADPVRQLSGLENHARLERELLRLPRDYREAFLLRHVEGLSYESMSRITGDSVGSLKVRVHRSRAKLRDALSAETEGTVREFNDGRDRRSLS